MSESQQPTHHGYAVNVKDHSMYDAARGPLTDDQVAELYDSFAEGFWMLAQEAARDHGFREVFSEGRMGGWAVPVPQPSPDSVGPMIEYVPESEMAEWVEKRFRPLERDLLALMADYRDEFLAELANAVERADAEPAERAYWEARDTVTIG
jgi:hypothetical protein